MVTEPSETADTVVRSCNRCGTQAEAPEGSLPEAWSFAVEDGRMVYQCPTCVRANIRAIEGKLPQDYWEY